MIMHSNASGLVSQYEYDDYSPRGKVLRNHTNLGENWQFCYFPTFTKVTDSLGMDKCDDGLVASADKIKSDTRGTPLTRSVLSKMISFHLGGDSNPEASCRR